MQARFAWMIAGNFTRRGGRAGERMRLAAVTAGAFAGLYSPHLLSARARVPDVKK